MSAIFPSRIRTLARTRGFPLPSTTLPLTSTTFCANADAERIRANNAELKMRIHSPYVNRQRTAERCQELSQGYAFSAYPWKQYAIRAYAKKRVRPANIPARLRRAQTSNSSGSHRPLLQQRMLYSPPE